MPKLQVIPGCALGLRALLAAKYSGASFDKLEGAKHPLDKCPLLVLDDGREIFEAGAAAKYLARSCCCLSGKTDDDKAMIDNWVEFCAEIDVPAASWVLPIIMDKPVCPEALKHAKGDVRKAMTVLNAHLANQTYLVGERLSVADLCVFASLLELYRRVLDAGFRKAFKNLNRWFVMMANQEKVIEVCGATTLCTKAEEPKKLEEPAKKAPCECKKAEKKEEKKPAEEEDDDGEEKKPAEKKPTNPLDLLPAANFNLDEWKREYSNNDTLTVAAPWLWEHWDNKSYSLWFAKYKYEHEEPQVFMVANGLTGWIQRLDPLRKYGFGCLLIFGTEKPFEVETLWMFRGQEVPKEMTDCDDSELYAWVKADAEKDRAKINAFLAWEGDFGGRVFNQGKTFK